ncbi:MAG: phosphatase [Bacteroidetes bacterium]|nr:phosphatase [Bacteroidota bacterium]
MILGIIDCGTNTFNILIVNVQKKQTPIKLHGSRIAVKLGEGGINSGTIVEKAYNRGIDALANFSKLIAKYNCNKVLAFATSAIRDAHNGPKFIEDAYLKTNINITIIDGNKEAELIYYGNKIAANLNKNTSLIMDIGGGSTEFIIANSTQIFWKKSYRLGASRLLQKFNPSNPINDGEINAISNYLNTELSDLIQAINLYNPIELIGSSGAFDSVVEIIHGELNGEKLVPEKIIYNVKITDFDKIFNLIIKSTLKERLNIKGLIEMRADMIVISCLLIKTALTISNLSQFRVSTYSLKEGAMFEFIEKNTVN